MTHQRVPHKNPALTYEHFVGRDVSYKVFPQLGGALLEWSHKETPILQPFEVSDRGIMHHREYCTSAILFPFPNRLEDGLFSHEGNTYQLPLNEPNRNNAIHGFLKDVAFGLSEVSNDGITLTYEHKANHQFPFSFAFEIKYHFSEDGVTIGYKAVNTGNQSFPFGIGWHPYFQIAKIDTAALYFEANYKYLTDDRMIPMNKQSVSETLLRLKDAQLDTGFHLAANNITLSTSEYTLSITIPQANYLQLFIPDDKKAIAIEPMTCISNAFNNGMGKKILQPKADYEFTMQLTIS